MINPRELRIGNFVYLNNTVVEITEFHGQMSNDYKPIKVTEDWLLMLGFIIEREGVYSFYYHGVTIIGYWLIDGATNVGNFIPQNIKSVHQLQNLYFALTGEELIYEKR